MLDGKRRSDVIRLANETFNAMVLLGDESIANVDDGSTASHKYQ